jgi:hypothetical protein
MTPTCSRVTFAALLAGRVACAGARSTLCGATTRPASGAANLIRSQVVALLGALLFAPTLARAQVQTIWQSPPEEIEVDFSVENRDRQVVLLEDGMAYEAPVNFMLVGRERVGIVADLPERGRFELALGGKPLAQIKDLATEDDRGRGDVVPKVRPMDFDQALRRAGETIDELIAPADRRRAEENANQRKSEEMAAYLKNQGAPVPKGDDALRDLYVRARALDKSAGVLREALDSLSKERPRWFTAEDRQSLAKLEVAGLVAAYQNVLAHQFADDYLHRCGLTFDSSSRNVRDNLRPMLEAVHVLMTGRLANDPESGKLVASALTSADVGQLRQSLGIQLKARFYPQADPSDPNAQWFNGQRVACRATGVSIIRVEGTLNPAAGDRVDWWILDRYDPEKTKLESSSAPGLQIDDPFVDPSGAKLRVATTGKKPISYWFEFRAEKPGQLKVVVQESTSVPGAKFPF